MHKTIKAMLAALAMLVTGVSWADNTEVVDGITWTYVVSDCEASVGGGNATAVPTSTKSAITIPSKLGGCPVTSIGNSAFSGCSGLTSMTIPEGVTSIGECAFAHCGGLTNVTIPSSVTSIGVSAFCDCSGLTSVTIPSSVTSIGDSAFCDCVGLNRFAVDEANPNYKSINGLLLTKDGTLLIAGVNGEVTIPSSVTNIGEGSFWGCSGLTSVTIPEGVSSIGEMAFAYCSGLTSVTIPSSVTSIGDDAFWGCGGLNRFAVDEANPNYKSINGLLLTKDGTLLIAGVNGEVTIPEGVTSIGDDAFHECSGLTSVTIPSSVTSIGDGAFFYCYALTSVTIPSSVTNIGEVAFFGCSVLTSVTIPSSVTSIGEEAFYECSGLTTIYVDDGDEARVKQMLQESRFDTTGVVFKVGSGPVIGGFDGSVKHTFNGLVYDSGVMCGMIQIATAKATKKGVKVSGTVILEDGKKVSIKAVTVAISGGQLVVNTTVGKLGALQVTIGENGFEGTLGNMTVAKAEVDEETGILSATVKLTYFDAKTGKIKTKSYKLNGITSGGEAVGSVSLKSDVKEFEAVVK